ncbi:MAG: hypothetical protein QG673_1959, partial [Pseudomonadota bacterium]|nr:hypothetical protein [Pseudomonadota bacterium]
PLINFQTSNPNINMKDSPFFVNKQLLDWSGENNKYAAVSAFGIGGTNAHIILEEYKQIDTQQTIFNNKLLIFSAKNKQSLELICHDFINYLETNQLSSATLSNIAYTLQTGRDNFNYRKFGIGSTPEEITTYLKYNSTSYNVSKINPKLVFMFSGQGSQYSNMGMDLYNLFPYFAKIIDECSKIADSYLDTNIISIISNNTHLIEQTQYTQPVLFIIEYALAKLFIHFGVTPDAMIGHSIGEYVAACISGVFSLEDAIKIVCTRGKLMSTAKTGKMIAIECTIEEFNQLPNNHLGVELALHNSTDNCVASGSAQSINKLTNIIKDRFKYKVLHHVSHAFHSYLMEEVSNIFVKVFTEVKLNKPQIPIISNLTGTWLKDADAINPQYWGQHLRYTVQFKTGIDQLINSKYDHFLEIGPGSTLCSFTKTIAQNNNSRINAINSLSNYKKTPSDEYCILNALGILWQNNINVNWHALYQKEVRRHIPLPTYRFNRQRYWIEPDTENIIECKDFNKWLHQPTWIRQFSFDTYCYPINNKEHTWLIFTHQDNFLGHSLIKVLKQCNQNVFIIESNPKYSNVNNKFKINVAKEEDYLRIFQTLHNKGASSIIILHLFAYSITSKNMMSSNGEINVGLKNGFYSILYMSRSYLKIFNNNPLKCAVITNNSQQVIGTELTNPINSTLSGLCKTIPQEHELLKYKLIDIDVNKNKQKDYSTSIINYCINDKWFEVDSIVAIREQYLWILRYHKIETSLNINRLKNNGIYLITGGLGGISLTLCQAITNQVSTPTFILVSRSEFPHRSKWHAILEDVNQTKLNETVRTLLKIEEAGGTVHIEHGDVVDEHQIKKIIQKTINTCGEITGIIHAAGIAGHGIMLLKTDDEIHEMFAAKIYGTYNLAKAVKNIKLDFVMLCSSISSIVGVTGLSDYSSANACLDSVATSKLFKDNFVVSINWNTWSTTGMAVNQNKFSPQEFIDIDNKINSEQGKEIFLNVLQNAYPQVIVSKFDIIEYSKLVNKQYIQPVHEESLVDIELEDNNYVPPNNAMEMSLVKIWQELFGINRISITDDFFILGGHSLKALKFVEIANSKLGCKLAPQQLYEFRTIQQLAKTINVSEATFNNIIIKLNTPSSNTNNPINIFLFPPVSGTIFCYDTIASNCSINCNIYGLQDPSIMGGKMLFSSIIETARFYLEKIREIQPNGPYYFIGYSFGGTVAHEISHLLVQQNQHINLLAMIDSWAIFSEQQFDENEFKKVMAYYNKELTAQTIDLSWQRMKILLSHKPSTIKQDMLLFKATQLLNEFSVINDVDNHWHLYNSGIISVYPITANHETIIYPQPSLSILKTLEDKIKATIPECS